MHGISVRQSEFEEWARVKLAHSLAKYVEQGVNQINQFVIPPHDPKKRFQKE
jgi:hypothetical protein